MADQTSDRTPLQAMARSWPIVVLCFLLGAGAGVAVSLARPTTYTASARLAVGGESLAAQLVPGFALASQQLASNYSRFVETAPVVAALPVSARGDVISVSASPVPESNVVLLEASAASRSAAVLAAHTGATQLRDQVADAIQGQSAADVLVQYTTVTGKVSQAQQAQVSAQAAYDQLRARVDTIDAPTATQLSQAASSVAKASSALQVLQVQQNALGTKYQAAYNATTAQNSLEIVQPGAPEFDDGTSKAERYGLAGAVLGVMLAGVIAVARDRRRVRDGSATVATSDRTDLASPVR